jgi:uncharacterized protein YecE (DUF72 family)
MSAPDDRPGPDELRALAARVPHFIRFGTSSWNYPGWQGLVYHRKYPASGAVAKMLEEYARYPLFRTVGIDASFYRPLSAATWRSYASVLPVDFPCVSKVWQRITVHTFSGHGEGGPAGTVNPDFLDAALFEREVLRPALDAGGTHVGPFVFEIQAIPHRAGLGPDAFAERLDRFFGALPPEARYTVEIRNPEYYTPAYRAVLREHRVGHVFNSWTRMPPVGEQLRAPDAITADVVVCRALLRPGRLYEEAVDAFAPYDRIREVSPDVRDDLLELLRRVEGMRVPAFIVVNNRLEGCSPATILALMRRQWWEGPLPNLMR